MPDKMPGVTAATRAICSISQGRIKLLFSEIFDADGMTAASMRTGNKAVGGSADISFLTGYQKDTAYNECPVRCLELHPATKIIVTVDCGISQSDACKELFRAMLMSLSQTIIKLQEHLPAEASAIVNPELEGTPANLRHLCGAGVAFKLAHQIARREAIG